MTGEPTPSWELRLHAPQVAFPDWSPRAPGRRVYAGELYLFTTGHGSYDIEERVRQQRVILEFLRRTVPTSG